MSFQNEITALLNDGQGSPAPLGAGRNKNGGMCKSSLVPPAGGAVAVWKQDWRERAASMDCSCRSPGSQPSRWEAVTLLFPRAMPALLLSLLKFLGYANSQA